MSGIFTISLDFELHWGVFDKKDRYARQQCYSNTLKLIPEMLDLFEQYNVHATWAVVGSLMAEDLEQWTQWKPAITPHYTLPQYSPYQWVKQHGIPEAYKSSHFAPATVRKIQDAAGQELATHTFSHFYCLELQDHPLAFEADLQAAKLAAHHFNNVPRSMVFPRNQYNSQYLKRCYEQGITAVRTNPSATFWRPVTNKGAGIFRKLIRTADAYVQVSRERSSYPLSEIVCKPGEPLQLKASRFLRPWNTKYPFVHHWLLQRICREMKIAAALGECYHLWWHPENFGDHPKENMAGLRVLLEQYKQSANRYGMQSWNMAEYASNLLTTAGTITTHQYAGSAG